MPESCQFDTVASKSDNVHKLIPAQILAHLWDVMKSSKPWSPSQEITINKVEILFQLDVKSKKVWPSESPMRSVGHRVEEHQGRLILHKIVSIH